MDPTAVQDRLKDAAFKPRAASFREAIDLSGDDDDLLEAVALDDSVSDAWTGIEPPEADAPDKAEPKAEVDPLAYVTPPPAPKAKEPVAKIPDEPEDEEDDTPERGGWVVALVCAGVGIIAICLLLPLAEENHQLAWQRAKLKVDLTQIEQQVKVNEEFLGKINNDPTLAERLAQRQMKFIRKGSTILELPDTGREEMSPFQLVTLPPPNPTPPYRPIGGVLSAIVRNARSRLYLTGLGLLLLAAGLVLGGDSRRTY